MKVYLTETDGARWRMPPPLRWEIERTDGSPCDAAQFVFCDDAAHREPLTQAAELTATEDGTVVFRGVVDEVLMTMDGAGCLVTVCCRGLAAKMMMRQLRAAEYVSLSAPEAAAQFAEPCGIRQIELGELPPVERMTVATGMTCWEAFCGFCRKSASVSPRFTADGTLTVGGNSGSVWALTDSTPILSLRYCAAGCREIGRQEMVSAGGVVVDAAEGRGQTRLVTVQTQSSAAGAEWKTAQQRVDEAERSALTLQVTLAGTMKCEPSDRLAAVMPKLGISRAMIIRSVVHRGNENGKTVTVTAEGARENVAV